MTNLELNKVLCEFMGRTYHKPTEDEIGRGSYFQYEPNFCEHRDTLAVLLQFLTDDQLWNAIKIVTDTAHYTGMSSTLELGVEAATRIVRASPRAWAEAVAKAIGKWVEPPAKCPTCGGALNVVVTKPHVLTVPCMLCGKQTPPTTEHVRLCGDCQRTLTRTSERRKEG